MRRDICRTFSAKPETVYNAYLKSITEKFTKNITQEPYETLSFGLSFSAHYNMNGGRCTLHFSPYNGGTAVNIRYTIVQLVGARYVEHEKDLSSFVEGELKEQGKPAQIPMSVFGLTSDEDVETVPLIHASDILIAFVLWLVFSVLNYFAGNVYFAHAPEKLVLALSILIGWISSILIVLLWRIRKL